MAVGALSFLTGAVWWWALPESERFFDCAETLHRNGCRGWQGSLGWPIALLMLGVVLVLLGCVLLVERWMGIRAERAEAQARWERRRRRRLARSSER